MRSLSAQHVGEIVRELAPLLRGARVREVQPHPPRDLLLVLEPGRLDPVGSIRRLRLSASPEGPRLHLQIGPVKRHTGPVGPFFRTVMRELEGATLRDLVQVAGDRLVRLDLLRADRRPCALVLELFGRQANLVLLDAGGRVLEVVAPPPEGARAAERLAPGSEWTPAGGSGPRPGSRKAPPLPRAGEPPERLHALAELAPLSWRVESGFGRAVDARHGERAAKDLADRLERRLKGARARLEGLRQQQRTTGDAERVREDAELLTAHLAGIERGAARVRVPDAFRGEGIEREIALDPGLSPRKNAEKLFARHRKLLRLRERLPEELEIAQRQIDGLEELLERAHAPDVDAAALEDEALSGGWLAAPKIDERARKTEPRLPYHRFFGARGSEIRVGRSARDNDELTFKHARGGDLWLHTRDSPGSHVVLVLSKGREPDPEEVLDAAHLAIHFSPLRDAGRVHVHIAPRKLVKKPRRAPPGLVTLSGGKERRIQVQPERLARVLATRGKPRPGASPA